MTAIVEKSGFPPGYFIIHSDASERVLDIAGDSHEDGAELLLCPSKETSLVESECNVVGPQPIGLLLSGECLALASLLLGFRDAGANSQVFFLDASGILCSRSSGHAIDVRGWPDGQLVVRHRHPISYPYPNKDAHPLPRWSYSTRTGEISVHFDCDPTYPLDPRQSSEAWRHKRYLLSAIPRRQPPSLLHNASAFFSNAFKEGPISLFGGGQSKQAARPDEVFDGKIDLKDEDLVDEERGEENEIDDSFEVRRPVRVLAISDGNLDQPPQVGAQTKLRRSWTIYPLRKSNARTGGL